MLTAASMLLAEPEPVRVGAIRWDAWHGDKGIPGKATQAALSPKRYQWRAPFFAEVINDDQLRMDGSTQEVVDREIDYAAAAGLRYWAFVTYPEGDALSLPLKRYLSSTKRERIQFCPITELTRWKDPAFVQRAARLMGEKGYLTVAGRPVLFLGFIDAGEVDQHWRGPARN